MKRTLIALAIASFSFAALAGAPTDKPPIGPIDVNVTNTPLSVEVSNADPIPVTSARQTTPSDKFRPLPLETDGGADTDVAETLTSLVTGFLIGVDNIGTVDCRVTLTVGTTDVVYAAGFAPQGKESLFVPLPNVEVAYSTPLTLTVETTDKCLAHAVVYTTYNW
jgi:hypothetical protein